MNLIKFVFFFALLALTGCAAIEVPPPTWNPITDQTEAEYKTYLAEGDANISGQAFMTTQGGSVIKAAGRNVTLDPATSTGNEWWGKAGKKYIFRDLTPPSVAFKNGRRTTVADADGKFKFTNIPAGTYYVRTEVTWEIGANYGTQGGLVGQVVDVKPKQSKEVILNSYPN